MFIALLDARSRLLARSFLLGGASWWREGGFGTFEILLERAFNLLLLLGPAGVATLRADSIRSSRLSFFARALPPSLPS